MYRFPTEDADTLVARLKKRTGPLIAIKQNELFEKKIPFARQFGHQAIHGCCCEPGK